MQDYDAAYRRNHRRVRSECGRAKDRHCVDCGKPALDWSQTHGTDGTSNAHFSARCRSCHVIYDGIVDRSKGNNWGVGNTGMKRTDEQRAMMSRSHIGLKHRPETIEKIRKSLMNRIDPD